MVGTQIIATNLYEEYPQRRAAFTRPNEQAVGIAEVLIKYAINFPHVKIAYVRDDGANRSGGSFCSSGNGDQHAVIRLLMSSNLTKDLFNFEVADEKLKFSADVCMVCFLLVLALKYVHIDFRLIRWPVKLRLQSRQRIRGRRSSNCSSTIDWSRQTN